MSRENILSNKYVRQMVNINSHRKSSCKPSEKKKSPNPQIHKEQKRHKQAKKKSAQIVKKYSFGMLTPTNTSQINAKSNQNILLSLSIL